MAGLGNVRARWVRGLTGVLGAGVLAAGLLCAPAMAQETDDWELGQDALRQMTRATVQYDGGKAIVVQCQAGVLKVVLIGLPATTAPTRHLDASRADGRRDRQGWFAEPGQTAFTSTVSGRDARFLRGGGLFELRSAAGDATPVRASFDLPTQNANLDRVLAACGYAATDDRDAIQRTGEDLKTEWEAEHANDPPPLPRMARSRSISGAARRPSRPDTPPTPPERKPAEMSCIVRAAVFADCRFDHTTNLPADAERRVERMNGVKLEPVSAAANEGRVYYPADSTVPLVVIDRIVRMN
jgi:hypothetical protein